MLTGDKIETAKCIAISTGLKNKEQDILEIKDAENPEIIKSKLIELDKRINKAFLIIDGTSLSIILRDPMLEE